MKLKLKFAWRPERLGSASFHNLMGIITLKKLPQSTMRQLMVVLLLDSVITVCAPLKATIAGYMHG